MKTYITMMSLATLATLVATVVGCATVSPALAQTPETQSPSLSEFYRTRYKLNDVYSKRVDNKGNGHEPLYGTRNFRAVLHGLQYRGGANNTNHRTRKRSNMNPLPNDGLQNLCEEGFSSAVYLYKDNFETAPKEVTCKSIHGGENRLTYHQINPMTPEGTAEILGMMGETLAGHREGPVYTHCWNGFHASGYISAVSLRQFCGVSPEAAVRYWNRNTDGWDSEPQFEKIRNRIRDFVPAPELIPSVEIQKEICPEIDLSSTGTEG